MNFYPERLPELLPYMGQGMLAIFLVMAVIIISATLLNRLTKK